MLILRPMEEGEISRLYEEHMRRDFPPSELKHLSGILEMRRRGEYDVLGAYEQGELCAYALIYCPIGREVYLLDYLAVLPGMRERGVGQALVKCLRQHYERRAQALMIECERPLAAPDEAEARRRIRFYEQAGACMTSVRIWLFDVEYSILVLPCNQILKQRDWAETMLDMYRQMLPPKLYEKNVRLIRN